MRFKTIAVALFACVFLGAFTANSVQAAQWTLGTKENQAPSEPGTKLPSEKIKCEKHPTVPFVLHSKITNVPITFNAAAVDCEGATIDSTAGGVAPSAGELTFTTVTVEPSTCSVPGGELTTKELTGEVIMDPAGGEGVLEKFFPEVGTTILEITLEGPTCPFAEITVPVKGTACGETVHTLTVGLFSAIP